MRNCDYTKQNNRVDVGGQLMIGIILVWRAVKNQRNVLLRLILPLSKSVSPVIMLSA